MEGYGQFYEKHILFLIYLNFKYLITLEKQKQGFESLNYT